MEKQKEETVEHVAWHAAQTSSVRLAKRTVDHRCNRSISWSKGRETHIWWPPSQKTFTSLKTEWNTSVGRDLQWSSSPCVSLL